MGSDETKELSGGKGKLVQQSEEETIYFHTQAIPKMLFNRLTSLYGIGEHFDVGIGDWKYIAAGIEIEEGCGGFIGYNEREDSSTFVVWYSKPKTDELPAYDPAKVLEIKCGPRNAGVWAWGKGHMQQDDVFMEWERRVSYRYDGARLAIRIAVIVDKLVRHPQLMAQENFWR